MLTNHDIFKMARNAEKQFGKLNRLWLQKERDEGRIKDVIARRPKLSTLNSAASVKKWIPSIKNEMEYYLQQSQLAHYPERRIAEFQQHLEELEREYKRYLTKLRALDPLCKHQPWTPRAYSKRRQEPTHTHCAAKRLCTPDSGVLTGPGDVFESDTTNRTGSEQTAASDKQEMLVRPDCSTCPASDPPDQYRPLSFSRIRLSDQDRPLLFDQTRLSDQDRPLLFDQTRLSNQDRPLLFDRTRLSVALAGSRVAPVGQQHTESLARILLSGLPNLHSSPLAQAVAAQRGVNEGPTPLALPTAAQSEVKEAAPEPPSTETALHSAPHVLGLGCYSSSDEDT